MSEKMTREDVVRMARAARLAEPPRPFNPFNPWGASDEALALFANKVIEHFLTTTGQYVTNDASREAAIQAAVEAEREACAKACEEQERGAGDAMTFYTATGQCAAAIRNRKDTTE